MKASRIVCLIAVLQLSCWGFSSQAFAFCFGWGGEPELSLVENWSRASVVVSAEVWSTAQMDNQQQVGLSVLEILKEQSEIEEGTLRIFTSPGFGSGAPFKFEPGKKVILFLQLDPHTQKYTPTSVTGCIEVGPRALRQYTAALRELPAILCRPEPRECNVRLMDWYVQCAAQAEMCEMGLAGISEMQKRLTPAQQEVLLQTLLAEDLDGLQAGVLAALLARYPSPGLNEYLLEILRPGREPVCEEITQTAIDELPRRLGIELTEPTRSLLVDHNDLAFHVRHELDAEQDAKHHEREQQRLNALGRKVASEVHAQCQRAMQRRE